MPLRASPQISLPAKAVAGLTHCAASMRGYVGWLQRGGWVVVIVAAALASFSHAAPADASTTRGLPFIRTYPLDEIGKVPRGLRLGFDSFGRFAVMYDGIYSVLNDSLWVDRIDATSENRIRMTSIQVVNGKYFYGGRGSWGTVDLTTEGRFRAHPLVPPDAPSWTAVTPFNGVVGSRTGVYFYELNGVVYWDYALQQNVFFELPRVTTLFAIGERIFVTCQDQVIREIHADSHTVSIVPATGLEGGLVEHVAALDPGHMLVALLDGRLMSFDGHQATPWPPQAQHGIRGRVSALSPLVNGGVAIALQGEGLVLVGPDNSLQWKLTLPDFRRVVALAANEPGVLWVAGENAVHKIFYDSPLTSFGQQLGLTAAWPKIDRWRDRLVVCSNQLLYELETGGAGAPARFKPIEPSPASVGCMSAQDDQILVGTPTGVLAAGPDGRFAPVITIENVGSIDFIAPDLCVVVGSREITALRFAGGKWIECAARIPGVGDAPFRTLRHGALWIELGGDRVARVTYRDGQLALRRLALPWKDAQWTNVGVVGNTIILSGATGQRAYYDDQNEIFCGAPALDALLNRSPYWITRVTQDAKGTLWATHSRGVVTFTPEGDDYVVDASSFELRNDSYPMILKVPGDSIWITSGRSLYRVEPGEIRVASRPQAQLVSLVADNLNRELLAQMDRATAPPRFEFDDNSLSFRFFSGSYAWRYPPLYEYRLGSTEPWTPVDPGLLLRFPQLRDGAYRLEVRPIVPDATKPAPLTLAFAIKPPPYRTPWAYVSYAVALLLLVFGIARWMNQRSRRHNESLELLVQERTHQLHTTMEKLNEETRNTATLAERSRLAGEIHDSLQQSLSGSLLQLDTTLSTAAISEDVRTRLNIVRRMLSYTRDEVQHSVLNLESPLLQDSNLGDALRQLPSFINSGTVRMNVVVPAAPISLEPAIQHHLLRIAQEAITNAVKHANATRIEVTLSAQHSTALLTIEDDGTGFDPAQRNKIPSHFGLRGMRTRARSIKADLQVRSASGQGTTIQVSVPISSPTHESNDQSHPT